MVSSCGGPPEPPSPTGTTEQALLVYGGPIYCGAGKNAGTGFGDVVAPPPAGGLPFVPLNSLRTAPNPIYPPDPVTGVGKLRPDIAAQYIQNADQGGLQAAIQLGKALFWDIQAGSDNRTACATCHFQAGGDVRTRNQLNPGANALFDGASTNYQLAAADFPFVLPDPSAAGKYLRNVDNVTGSAGVRPLKFKGVTVTNGVATEATSPSSDPIFGTMRQVTGVNTPSVINAAFNHRNFWNGRAQPEFNGVNPWGTRDPNAKPFAVDATGNIVPYPIAITNGSLASQAVGPPVSAVEMSAAGRTFPDIGKKLLASKPLGLQSVDPSDGVLGPLAVTGGNGLNTTYAALIQKAFYPMWWNSSKTVKLNGNGYTLMQANFSLFWGVAIMLYEATLISDASPMDQYVATRFDAATGLPKLDPTTGTIVAGDATLLQPVVARLQAEGITIPDPVTGAARAVTADDVVKGLALFERPVPFPGTVGLPPGSGLGCSFCHFGAETTSASVRNLTTGLEIGAGEFKGAGFDLRMERMFMGFRTPPPAPPQPPPPVPVGSDALTYDNATYVVTVTDIAGKVANQVARVNTYDVGWYNVGVRPTAENAGLGGADLAGLPLSWTEYLQKTLADPTVVKVPGGGLGCLDASGNPVSPPNGGPTTAIYPAAPLGDAFAGLVLDPTNHLPILSGGLSKSEATDVAGTFKTPSLRNVELNGPYFHTGGKATLRQVVDFYDEGGNFPNATLAPFIRPLGLTEYESSALVAFLVALTDDRVRLEKAPFDHPSLPIPVGQDAAGNDLVDTKMVPAVGSAGRPAGVSRFLGLKPFQR